MTRHCAGSTPAKAANRATELPLRVTESISTLIDSSMYGRNHG